MSLTSSQSAVLRASVSSDVSVSSAVAIQDWFTVAGNYNQTGTTKVWRSDFGVNEMINGNTNGPGIDWTEYSNLNNGQQTQFISITQTPVLDVTKQNIRVAIGQIFPAVSTASAVAAPSTRANLLAIAARFGTKFETLSSFMTAAGQASVSIVYGYVLAPSDVQQAMS